MTANVLQQVGRYRVAASLGSGRMGSFIVRTTKSFGGTSRSSYSITNRMIQESDVARAIAEEIQVQLSPQEKSQLARSRQVDPVAYEAFLKGRYLWYRRSPDALKKAVECFQQAISLDPTHALAHAASPMPAYRSGGTSSSQR